MFLSLFFPIFADFFKIKNMQLRKIIGAFILISIIALLFPIIAFHIYPIAGFGFATSVISGWHTTIFPPFLQVGFIFSLLVLIQLFLITTRYYFNLEDKITIKTISRINLTILIFGLFLSASYISELLISYYSGYIYEQLAFYNRVFGLYWWIYFLQMILCIISPLFFLFKKLRNSIRFTLIFCLITFSSTALERLIIITTTLNRDYLPSSWSYYVPNYFYGTIAFSLILFIGIFLYFRNK